MDGYGIVFPGVHTPPNPQNVSIVGAQQKMPPVRRARWLGRNLGVCGHLDKVGVFWQVSNGICDHFIFLQQYINKKRIQKQVHSTHNTIWRDFMIWSYLWLQFYSIWLPCPGCPWMFSTLQRNNGEPESIGMQEPLPLTVTYQGASLSTFISGGRGPRPPGRL